MESEGGGARPNSRLSRPNVPASSTTAIVVRIRIRGLVNDEGELSLDARLGSRLLQSDRTSTTLSTLFENPLLPSCELFYPRREHDQNPLDRLGTLRPNDVLDIRLQPRELGMIQQAASQQHLELESHPNIEASEPAVNEANRDFRVATTPPNDDVDLGGYQLSNLDLQHLLEHLVAFVGGTEVDSEERARKGIDPSMLFVEMGDLGAGATIGSDGREIRWTREADERGGREERWRWIGGE